MSATIGFARTVSVEHVASPLPVSLIHAQNAKKISRSFRVSVFKTISCSISCTSARKRPICPSTVWFTSKPCGESSLNPIHSIPLVKLTGQLCHLLYLFAKVEVSQIISVSTRLCAPLCSARQSADLPAGGAASRAVVGIDRTRHSDRGWPATFGGRQP